MKFTMTKIAAGLILAGAAMSAQAQVPIDTTSNFVMLDPTGAYVGGAAAPTLTGFIGATTWGVASTTTFFGGLWTASGGTLFGPGTYTVSTVDPGCAWNVACGGSYTFTVGANQIGGTIDFAWGTTTAIDVLQVWNVTDNGNGTFTYTSTDIDGDGILGIGMIDGPFQGFSANFNMAPCMLCYSYIPPSIPEASTYAMMLAGLGLVGFMARRRRNAEA